MRRTLMVAGMLLALMLGILWLTGGLAVLDRAAADAQRAVQDRLAGAVRALRTGQPGALTALLGVSFAYGFFHAAGPGHGKFLIGSYGVARRVRLLPLSAIALAASLAQSVVAIALVYVGISALDWTREQMVGMAEGAMAAAGHLAVAGIGLWLMWRGMSELRHAHGHGHHHTHGATMQEVSALTGWRDTLALIGGVAIRPCSGALFLLILTRQLGIPVAGIMGAIAMGCGVAFVTFAVAVLSVWAREGVYASLPGARIAQALPVAEIVVGGLVTLVPLRLLTAAV